MVFLFILFLALIVLVDILLDHMGVIKFVDFGAAKIIAKNQRSMQRSRRPIEGPGTQGGGLSMNNSLTGTPMYMSPEVIRNSQRGRHGAMDIWAMGCVVLECATGKKPWSNLDNEWYGKPPGQYFAFLTTSAGPSCSTLVLPPSILHCQSQGNSAKPASAS